jgi:hypothetical protein
MLGLNGSLNPRTSFSLKIYALLSILLPFILVDTCSIAEGVMSPYWNSPAISVVGFWRPRSRRE